MRACLNHLLPRRLVFALIAIVPPALLAATPPNQNFDAYGVVPVLGTNALTLGGVFYSNNDSISLGIVDDGNIASGADHALAFRSTGVGTSTDVRIASADGAEFKLNSFEISAGFGTTTNFTIKGYRNSVEVASATFNVSGTGGWGTFNVSGVSAWENIDEIHITGSDLDVDLDNLSFSAAVVEPVVTAGAGTTAYTENGAALAIASSLTVSDPDSSTLAAGTVSITTNFASGQDVLSFTNDGSTMGNISGSYSSGTGVLNLTSAGATATLAQWQAAFRVVAYSNSSDAPSTSTRTVSFVANDGTNNSTASTKQVSVAAVNDAPSKTGATGIFVTEDVASALTGFSFADVDAGGSSVTVTLSAGSGTFAATSGGGVTVSGSGTASLTLSGSIANINTFIAGSNVTFTTAFNSISSVGVVVDINDGGNTGSGGSLSAPSVIVLTVNGVNDGPTITAPGSIGVTEDVASALTGISFADVDAGSSSVTATLSVGSGTLAATSGGGVTASGSGTTSLTLSGSIANINTFISGSNVSFTTAFNVTTSVTLTVDINDGAYSGSGGPQSASTNVTLTVTAVNDAPANSIPGGQSMTMDTTRLFNTGNSNLISVADVDAGTSSLQISLTSTNGTATLSGISGLSFTVGNGTANAAMTFTGNLTSINAALNGLGFTPTAGYAGSASLQIVTNDQGNSGTGGALSDTDSISITVSSTNPAVTSVSSPSANGTYKIGDTLSVTATFSQTVTVNTAGGTPTLLLETGTVDRNATYTSGSGTNTLTFSYTVQTGDLSADLDYASTSALALNGATIRNTYLDNATLTLPATGSGSSLGGQKALVVDGVIPTVSTVGVPANSTYRIGQTLTFTVNFSEPIVVNTGGGTPRLAVTLDTGGTVYATYASGSGTSALVFSYTVASGNSDLTGVAVGSAVDANGGTLRDVAGNSATLTLNSVGSTAAVLVDGITPSVATIVRAAASPTNLGSLPFTVTFSEPVTGVDATDFNAITTGAITGTVASLTAVNATVYTGTITIGAGEGTVRLDLKASGTGITDIAGNPILTAFTGGEVYTIDRTAPTFTSAVSVSGTYAAPLSYVITGNESPLTFASSSLPTGLSLASNGTISGICGIVGDFTVTLSITDAAGNSASRSLAISIARSLATVTVGSLAQTYDGQPRPATATTAPAGLPVTLTYGGSSTPPTNAGSYAVLATVSDTNYFGTGSGTLVIAKASQTIAFSAPATVAIGTPVTLSATASSGLAVTFSLVSGNATLTGSALTLRDGLPVVVRASQAGHENLAAASADLSLTAGKLAQTITFAALTDRATDSPAFGLTATASSGLPVSFSIVSGPATLGGSLLTLTGTPGTVVVRASQSGDAIYTAATDVERTFEVTATAVATRLINLSTRGTVNLAGGRPLILGFVVSGPAPKRILLRAAGPALAGFDVTGVATNPRLQVFDNTGRLVLENDDWSGAETSAAFAQSGAFAFPAGSRDAATVAALTPGAYSMHILDSGSPGAVLGEIYDLGAATEAQRVVNLSARGNVDVGAPFIAGFVIAGPAPKRVLIRAAGPALAGFNVAGALTDPRLIVYNGATIIAQNDDWGTPQPVVGGPAPATAGEITAAALNAGAFALAAGSRDSAVVLTLAPGAYTAQAAAGANATVGVALVEIYELP